MRTGSKSENWIESTSRSLFYRLLHRRTNERGQLADDAANAAVLLGVAQGCRGGESHLIVADESLVVGPDHPDADGDFDRLALVFGPFGFARFTDAFGQDFGAFPAGVGRDDHELFTADTAHGINRANRIDE